MTSNTPLPPEHPQRHFHYLVYGQRLCSTVALAELPRAAFAQRDIQFRYVPADAARPVAAGGPLIARRSTNVGCDLLVYDQGAHLLLRWADTCDFLLSRSGHEVTCLPSPGTTGSWVAATLYGVVLAYALHLRGVGTLHGAAVDGAGGAVGLLAQAGSGKSTLAAALAAAGHPFLTDDVLAVQEQDGEPLVQPGFPYVSLSPWSLSAFQGQNAAGAPLPPSGKRRVAVDGSWASFCGAPRRLQALFLLGRRDQGLQVAVEPVSRQAAVQWLLENTNCLPLLPVDAQRRQMAFVARLVQRVPVWRLAYPPGATHLPQVVQHIREVTLQQAVPLP